MSVKMCQRCGKEIAAGGLFYKVKFVSKAGFDGVLNDDGLDDVKDVVAQVEDKDHEAMERDVYFEMEAILCIGCKEKIIESFQKEVEFKDPSDPGERLH